MVMSFPTDQSTFYILKQIATLNSDFISAERVIFYPRISNTILQILTAGRRILDDNVPYL